MNKDLSAALLNNCADAIRSVAERMQKQNEPPSCGTSPAPVGASVDDILARVNALETRCNDLEDCANDGPSVCDGHATLKTIIASHWDHIVALQGRVTELTDHLLASVKAQDGSIAWLQKQVTALTENVNASETFAHDASVWQQKAITNLLKAGCDDPEQCAGECLPSKPSKLPEPSVPVSELRELATALEFAGVGVAVMAIDRLIAKAEGGAK